VVKGFIHVKIILADDDVCYRFLVVLGDSLGYSPDFGGDEEGDLKSHGIVGNFHLSVLDGELYLRSHQLGVLVDWNLVYGGIILLLFLLSLLLLLFRGHASFNNII
jgi:hypothetical protein